MFLQTEHDEEAVKHEDRAMFKVSKQKVPDCFMAAL
jgi:hypothetical protein